MPMESVALQGFFLRSGGSISAVGKVLQRKSAIQLRPGKDAFPVKLQPKSGGWPLPRDIQRKMETALSANFSDVRIHVGPEAASIGAIAFTWGSDIHFSPGQYNPHTPHGQFLLGHELTHVVQQRAGRVSNPFGSGVAVVQDHALEAEADRLGKMAASSPAPREAAAVSPSSAQRFSRDAAVINRKPVNGKAAAVDGKSAVINRKPAVINRKPAPPPVYSVRPATPSGGGWRISVGASGKNQPVASVQLTPKDKGVYISDLQVAPEHRRHGLARQLIQAAMRTARSQGFSTAQLEARPDSHADTSPTALVSMYQGFGFRAKGLTQRGATLMERTT